MNAEGSLGPRMAYFILKEWGNYQVGEFLYYEIGSNLMSYTSRVTIPDRSVTW
jgi:hypothetical protein